MPICTMFSCMWQCFY